MDVFSNGLPVNFQVASVCGSDVGMRLPGAVLRRMDLQARVPMQEPRLPGTCRSSISTIACERHTIQALAKTNTNTPELEEQRMARFDIARRVKRKYLDLRIRMRYGTTHPTVVKLADGFHQVRIDPTDPRARKKIASDGIRRKRRRNQVFWVAAVDEFRPDVALDIGVNFGECLFQANYPPETRAFGIDGNPDLLPFLKASCDLHPQGSQIEVLNALVAEKPASAASFFVSQKASGGSTAVSGVTEMREGDFEEKQVPVTSVDALLERVESVKRLVFKIDVEGFEGQVLRGMNRTLDECETAIGFIEFDTRMLTRAGENLPNLWRSLQERFDIHMFVGHQLLDLSNSDWPTALATCQKTDEHTDLLLIGGQHRDGARAFANNQFASHAAN